MDAVTAVSQTAALPQEDASLRWHTVAAAAVEPRRVSASRIARRAILRLRWYDLGVIGLLLASAAAIVACLLDAA